MGWDWQGNVTATILIIALVVCFCWIPVVTVLSLVHNGKRRFRTVFEEKGWVKPDEDEQKRLARLGKAPEIKKPPPARLQHSPSLRTQPSASSYNRLSRWNTEASWDPIKRVDTASTSGEPVARNNSLRSNYSRAHMVPSRPGSVRSVSTAHHPGPVHGGRTRRLSFNNGLRPTSFHVDNAYYDTTPLPRRSISHEQEYAKSASQSRSHSKEPHHRRGASMDQSRRTPGRDSDEYDGGWDIPPPPPPPPVLESAGPARHTQRRDVSHAQTQERQAWLDSPHAM